MPDHGFDAFNLSGSLLPLILLWLFITFFLKLCPVQCTNYWLVSDLPLSESISNRLIVDASITVEPWLKTTLLFGQVLANPSQPRQTAGFEPKSEFWNTLKDHFSLFPYVVFMSRFNCLHRNRGCMALLIIIDREAREIIHLVASVCQFVCLSVYTLLFAAEWLVIPMLICRPVCVFVSNQGTLAIKSCVQRSRAFD